MAIALSAPVRSRCFGECSRRRSLTARTTLAAALFCAVSASVFAQTTEQQSIKLGETDLYPSLEIKYVKNDNAFLTFPGNETETAGVVLIPSFNWVADRRLLKFRGNYTGEFSRNDESALDYSDHQFSADVSAELSARKRTSGQLSVEFGHQELGTDLTRGEADENSEAVTFTRVELGGDYTYGATNAKGNVTGGAQFVSHAFTNRSDVTDGDDYTALVPFGIFSYRLSPSARALAELRLGIYAFDDSYRDRNDISVLAGLEFGATGKSGGRIKIGSSLSNYKASSRDNESNLLIEASVYFNPKPFSQFTLTANREIDNEDGSSISNSAAEAIANELHLNWRHEWSSRVYHKINIGYRAVDRGCPSEDLAWNSVGAELNVKLRHWIEIGVNGSYRKRTASICPQNQELTTDLDYERQLIGVHVRATM